MDTAQPAPVVVVAPAPAEAPAAVAADPVESAQVAVGDRSAHAGERPVTIGATTFLLAGVGTSGVLGLSAFVDDPLSTDVVLRIGAAGGRTPVGDLPTTWAAARLETCYEATGNYAAGQGLLFGLCGGADVGATFYGSLDGRAGQTLPFIGVGPSVELGAEVGDTVAIVLRAGVGLSVARDAFVDASGDRTDPSLGTERAEIGLTWKLR